MRAFFREFGRGLLQLFLPNTCWICQRHLPEQRESFCRTCRETLIIDPFPSCPRCGATVGPHVPLQTGCIHCSAQPLAFDGVLRVGVYDGRLREVILKLKQPGAEDLAEAASHLFAESLAPRLKLVDPDVVIPIPLHWTRYWRRGFNQSEILGRALAEKLGKPFRLRALRRVKRTPSQQGLTAAQRRKNIKGAFAAYPDPSLRGKICVLVDDVLTTGATANEAAAALRSLEPRKIFVCVAARP